MFKILFGFALFFSSASVVASTSFTATCKGRDFALRPLTLVLKSSLGNERNEFGHSDIKIVNDLDSSTIIDLARENQIWLRETEQGITSFGIFDNSAYSGRIQKVYIQLAYDNLGLYESFRQMLLGNLDKDFLFNQKVTFQVFGDKISTALSAHFECNFKLD